MEEKDTLSQFCLPSCSLRFRWNIVMKAPLSQYYLPPRRKSDLWDSRSCPRPGRRPRSRPCAGRCPGYPSPLSEIPDRGCEIILRTVFQSTDPDELSLGDPPTRHPALLPHVALRDVREADRPELLGNHLDITEVRSPVRTGSDTFLATKRGVVHLQQECTN